jgi:hypothetical protein
LGKISDGFIEEKEENGHNNAPNEYGNGGRMNHGAKEEHQRSNNGQEGNLPHLQLHHGEGHHVECYQHQYNQAASIINNVQNAEDSPYF